MSDTYVEKNRQATVEDRMALVALIYASAAALFSWDTYLQLFWQYAGSHFIALPGILFFGFLGAAVIIAPNAPLSFIKELLRRRGRGAAATIVVFCFAVTAFSTFKHSLPQLVPFFADKPLADLDDFLLGDQAWELAWRTGLSDVIGPPLYFLYGRVWFAQLFGLFLLATFLTDEALRRRYLLSFTACAILLGTLARIAGASAGPIFFDRMFGESRFMGLIARLSTDPAGQKMLDASDYLYSSYLSDAAVFGSGISAMPSMHVAMAVLNALFLRSINRWVGFIGWIYALAIMFGSVYFGWHYLTDGIVSIAAVVVIWWLAPVMISGRRLSGTR